MTLTTSNKIVYITHCSAKKNDSLKEIRLKVTPDLLYTSARVQGFMKTCKQNGVNWAIFSDKYGVWFSDVKNRWYEKSPDSITGEEYKYMVRDFVKKLNTFDEIWFYYNPGRFHRLYRKLLHEPGIRKKIRFFTHLSDIEQFKI